MPLFYKDLRQYGVELLPLVLFELATVFSLLLQLKQATPTLILSLAFGISLTGGFVFSFRTVASEESSRSMAFLLALPMTPQQIVLHKFMLNLLLTTLNFLLVFGAILLYCLWQTEHVFVMSPVLLTLWLLQVLNNHLFLGCALLFSSSKAIWLPFPLLLIGINLAANWDQIERWLQWSSMPAWGFQLLLLATVLALFVLSRAGYASSIARREWS